MSLVGAHVPSEKPLVEAEARNADLVQIFLSNPQSWKKPLPREDAEELRSSPIPVYVHAPYLINVCADNNRVRIPSRKILQDTCDAAADIGAAAVVVLGGHVTGDGPRYQRTLSCLDRPPIRTYFFRRQSQNSKAIVAIFAAPALEDPCARQTP